VIDAGSQEQDALLREWPHGHKGAPVWHMDEPLDRLVRLSEAWPRVCIGSTGEYWQILSPAWCRQMDAAWDALAKAHTRTPVVHMLRGMQLSGREWPFASVDSTDIAQNHNRAQNTPRGMADLVGFVFQDPEAQFVVDTVEDELAFAEGRQRLPLDKELHVKLTLGWYSRFFYDRSPELNKALSSVKFK
jgi:energy-coupling factor transporter ATP-binding protein EcfA2